MYFEVWETKTRVKKQNLWETGFYCVTPLTVLELRRPDWPWTETLLLLPPKCFALTYGEYVPRSPITYLV